MTTFSAMKSILRSFERKAILGAAALAGTGATAAVAKWQDDWSSLQTTRDDLIAAGGDEAVVASAYDSVSGSLESLETVIASGHKEAILEAGMGFYATLLQAHEVVARYVPEQVRGQEKDPPETLGRISSVITTALGL